MNPADTLIELAAEVQAADSPTKEAIALCKLRMFLIDHDPLDLHVSILHQLSAVEVKVPTEDRPLVRAVGHEFPDELENCVDMFCA